jgi:predicted permease
MRHTLRTLRKAPGFTLAAILTLGLAIGADSAFFSVIHGILIEPLPYPQPDRLVVLYNTYNGKPSTNSVPDTMDRVRGATTLESVGALWPTDFNVNLENSTAHITGATVTSGYFRVLQVQPAVGRLFVESDDQPGANDVVILSDKIWRQYFGANPAILGQHITVNAQPQTIVGVMPPNFRSPIHNADLWRPAGFRPDQMAEIQRGSEFLNNIGRMKQGATIDQVRVQMRSLAAQYVEHAGARQEFVLQAKFSANASSLMEQTVGLIRRPLLILLGAAGLVMLIALANVANLMLAHSSARQREIYIRSTLGASRLTLFNQLMAESLLLSCLGGIFGLLLAYWGVRSLVALALPGIPRLNDVVVDYRMAAFAIVLSIVTGILFGALPAWTASRPQMTALYLGSRGSVRSGKALRQSAVAIQVAVAQVLLVGAGLLIGSIEHLMSVNPGFSTDNRLAFRVALPSLSYPNAPSQSLFFSQLVSKLQTLPGVQAAGVSSLSPFDVHNETGTLHVEGHDDVPERMSGSEPRRISGSYLSAIGLPLIEGRTFDDRDRADSPLVVLIDQKSAARFWPGQSALGKRVRFGPRWREVVGVVGSVKNERLDSEGQTQVYIPMFQEVVPNMTAVLHTNSDPQNIIREAGAAVSAIDRNVSIFDTRSLEQRVEDSVASRRYTMILLGGFGLAGLIVSVIGLYGVVAYSVRQRTTEIGIRIALGARAADVLGNVVGKGVGLASIGIAIGAIGAFWTTRFMESLLFEVSSTDPKTFALVSTCLLLSCAAASYIPASRAARIDPARTLRGD